MQIKKMTNIELIDRFAGSLIGFYESDKEDMILWTGVNKYRTELLRRLKEEQRAIMAIDEIKQEMCLEQYDEDKLIQIQHVLTKYDLKKEEANDTSSSQAD